MTANTEKNPIPFSVKTYSAITTTLTPLFHISKPLLSLYGGFKDSVSERLGKFSPVLDELASKRNGKPLIFIHAVSVGEAAVTGAIIKAIRERRDDVMFAVSTTTFTGRDYIKKNFDVDALFFFPLDILHVMRRLVGKLNPTCFLDIEVELWPNLFRALTEKKIPMALANGRISDRAANPPWIVKSTNKWMYRCFDGLFMRSTKDVERVIQSGAPENRTQLAGNLKFAACGQPPSQEERKKIRKFLGLDDRSKLFVAGSTHPGEDGPMIDAWVKLLTKGHKAHIVIAPRHLEQVERISTLVKLGAHKFKLWTDVCESGGITDDTKIIIVNTIGDLMKLYSAADAAFVGGSLVERGGHNVLEPVAMGIPTLHGPSMANFHDLKIILGDAGLLWEVKDFNELADNMNEIFIELDCKEYMKKARDLIDTQMKAADIIADWVILKLEMQ